MLTVVIQFGISDVDCCFGDVLQIVSRNSQRLAVKVATDVAEIDALEYTQQGSDLEVTLAAGEEDTNNRVAQSSDSTRRCGWVGVLQRNA
jgi:hypothetical protein